VEAAVVTAAAACECDDRFRAHAEAITRQFMAGDFDIEAARSLFEQARIAHNVACLAAEFPDWRIWVRRGPHGRPCYFAQREPPAPGDRLVVVAGFLSELRTALLATRETPASHSPASGPRGGPPPLPAARDQAAITAGPGPDPSAHWRARIRAMSESQLRAVALFISSYRPGVLEVAAECTSLYAETGDGDRALC